MTEVEWLVANDPTPMLEFLRGKASDRKLRLFAAAAFRRLIDLLTDIRQRKGIELLEEMAEGALPRSECRGVTVEIRQAIPRNDLADGPPPVNDLHYIALMLYRELCSHQIGVHAVQATTGLANWAGEQHEQTGLMRCIFGNPFRPVTLDPRWQSETVVALATSIYAERAFDRMPILADALEEAGCDHADILAHCRGDGPHARGCWVVDLLLGKS